ncbi:MAG TPA: SLBB domain-containing protein [Oculatellaceae cyanobacterium]|jgi:polysaccharide export outer membrane protein
MSSAELTNSQKLHGSFQYSIAYLTLTALVVAAMPTPGMAQQPLKNAAFQVAQSGGVLREGAYTLGAGDRVRIDVFNVPEYSGEYQVLVDGTINLPIIGSVTVQGRSLQTASTAISNQFARYLKRPLVTVSLLSPRPVKIALSGEVNRAGSVVIPFGEGRQFPTLSQAIQIAGGTTQAANIRQVQVRRRISPGRQQVITSNLWDVLENGNLAQDITLRDGDTIFIPTVAAVSASDSRQLANSNLGTQVTGPIRIAMVGEVSRPGTYNVQPQSAGQNGAGRPATLTQAILLAGGLTPSAGISQIQIRRPTRSGSDRVMAVNVLQLLQQGDLSQDVMLQEGDTVLVPTRTDNNPAEASILAASTLATQVSGPLKVALVGEVNRPGTYAVKPEVTSTNGTNAPPTLTQALQVAGGIKPTANIRAVEVRRNSRNGAGQVIALNLWQLLQGGDLSQDILLQEGDTIVVPTATNLDPREAEALAQSTFSPDKIRVNIVGEVKQPGAVELPPNTPLNLALQAAGGFNNSRARTNRVDLVRLNPDGTVSKRSIGVDLARGIDQQNNPTLRNNDVIVVNRSNIATFSDTLGTVLSPLGGVFSLFNFFRIFQ